MTNQQPLPHDDRTEAAVLAAVLLSPEVLDEVRAVLGVNHFHLERHQVLYRAYLHLAAYEIPIDLRTVSAHLKESGTFEEVGGMAFLAGLDLDLPDLGRVSHYARIVREFADRRRLIQLAWHLEQHAQGPSSDGTTAATIAAQCRTLLEAVEDGSHGEIGTQGVELAGAVIEDARRRVRLREETGQTIFGLPTGLPRLDELLGGIWKPFYLLVGPPAVGKTSLAAQIALQVTGKDSATVIYVTYENSPEALVRKILGAAADVSQQDYLRGTAAVDKLQAAADRLRPALERLILVDGDPTLTVGRLRSIMRTVRGPGLLVVDYLQEMAKQCRELRHLADARTKVDTLTGELIALAKSVGWPVLALSSQSRSAGRYGRGGGSASLDSPKESGGIEYAADVAMFLTPADDEGGATRGNTSRLKLTIGKAREGPTGEVDLVFLKDRGIFREEVNPEFMPVAEPWNVELYGGIQ